MSSRDNLRIDPRQQVNLQGPSAKSVAYAKPVDLVTSTGTGGELAALMDGLHKFNGSFANLNAAQDKFDAKEAQLSGQLAAETNTDPATASTLPPPAMPQGLNVAFKDHFDVAFREGLGARLAAKEQDRALADYNSKRLLEDFNQEEWLARARAEGTAEIQDPVIRLSVAKAHDEVANFVRSDQRRVVNERFVAQNKASVNELVSTMLTPDRTPEKNAEIISQLIMPAARKSGAMTPVEVQGSVFAHLQAESIKAGGRPELFDVFKQVDPTTKLPLEKMLPPEMQVQLASARKTAEDQLYKRTEEAKQGDYADLRMRFEDEAKQGRLMSFEGFRAQMLGKDKPFKRDDEVISEYHKLAKLAGDQASLAFAIDRVQAGQAALLDPKVRKEALDHMSAPAIASLMQAHQEYSTSADPAAKARAGARVDQLLANIANIYGGSGEVNEKLKSFISGVKSEGVTKDGKPSPNFELASKAYHSMPPGQRGLYGDDDTQALFERYKFLQERGSDATTAYQKAYWGISKEGKAYAKELRESPDFKSNLSSSLRASQSNSLWDGITTRLGFVPDNLKGNVATAAAQHVQRIAEMYPEYANDKDWLGKQAEDYVRGSWFQDKANNILIEKAPGLSTEDMSKALSLKQLEWTAAHPYATYGFATVLDQGGRYTVFAKGPNGLPVKRIETFDMQEVVKRSRITGDDGKPTADGKLLAEAQALAREGKIDLKWADKNKDGIARLKVMGVMPGEAMAQIEKAQVADYVARSRAMPKFSFGTPDVARFDTPASGYARSDTLAAAQSFVEGNKHGLALTAMREGFVPSASPDPNRSAGNNIGFGYNLKSRSMDQIKADFRAAGIPVERTSDIVEGKASITREQGMRLLEHSRKAYEAQVITAVTEGGSAAKWSTLPSNVQDVLVDVAYQTGNINQFKRALEALRKGDTDGLDKLLTVKYRSGEGEAYKPDARGNNLRAHLLDSTVTFASSLKVAGSKPSTKLDTLAQKGQ